MPFAELSLPGNFQAQGVEGLAGEYEVAAEFFGPAAFDELQKSRLFGAVDFIAHDGKAEMGKMDADLMGAAGEGQAGNFTEAAARVGPSSQAAEAGETLSPLRMHRALQPDRTGLHQTLADDGLIDIDFLPVRMSVDQGEVFLFRLAVLQAHRQRARGLRVFRHQNEPARLAIQPRDDGGLAAIRHFEREQLLQPTEQGGLDAAVRRMHDQGRGLGDDDVVVTLIDHGKLQDRLWPIAHEWNG